jgi:hypothetical protein
MARRITRMSGRDIHEDHRVSTPLELLFDLTFATAFAVVDQPAIAVTIARQRGCRAPVTRHLPGRDLLGMDELLVVCVGLRYGRLDLSVRDNGPDGGSHRPCTGRAATLPIQQRGVAAR